MSTFCQVLVGTTIWTDCSDAAENAQMIAFEVALVFTIALVGVVTIGPVGRIQAEVYAEKLKTRYKAIGLKEAPTLRLRVESLENEIREIKSQPNE